MSCYQNIKLLTLFLFLIVKNAISYMDMDELKSVYYGLNILSEPVVMDESIPNGAVHVTSRYGQQYQCSFPDHSSEEKKKEEEEKIAIEMGVVEMLKPMASRDCLFKTKDWWSYEFCYGKYVRQYHMEDGEIRGDIIYLGNYEGDFDWSNETAKDERLKNTLNGYHSQSYTQGTKCDLTGKMRTTEVRFLCEENSEDYLARIDESQTCVYTVTVMTSRICRHPFFKSPVQRKSVPITCNPLLTQDQFNQFHEERTERLKTLERYRAQQKKKEPEKDKASGLDRELTQTLENEMSAQAKELLGKPLDEFFHSHDQVKELTKEKFEEAFGQNERLWKLYQKGLDIKKKQQEKKLKEQQEKQQQAQDEKPSDEEKDEDDEIISEFKNEIEEIKHRYQSSQNKLAGIRKKLSQERNWESDLEQVIKEAEQEFGLKVDRNLVAGLSDTLNKLINKLQDTEAELNSMDNEINNLKPEDVRGGKTETSIDTMGKEPADISRKQDSQADAIEEENTEGNDKIETISESPLKKKADDDDDDEEEKKKDERKDGASVTTESLEDKIEAPPITGEPQKESSHGEQSTFPLPKDATEDQSSEAGAEKPEVKVKVNVAGEENEEDELKQLPGNIRKLLEESVLKEYEKKNLKRGSERLGLDDDHSYTRDKTVHVIQQEDENGHTNRFIFVLGFNNFDDESEELERQSALEENYGFVYKGSDRRKKSEAQTESEPDR